MGRCPICNEEASVVSGLHDGKIFQAVQCARCGRYSYFLDEVGFGNPADTWLLPYLSAYIRQNQPSSASKGPLIDRTWTERAKLHAATTVPGRLEKILRWTAKESKHPGDIVAFSGQTAPLFDASGDRELKFLLDALEEQGALKKVGAGHEYRLTPRGWELLAPIGGAGVPGRVFVAMSFDEALNDAFTLGIERALRDDCGFGVIRVDRVQHNDNINDKILAEIRSAQFVVADFTGHRAGVYFEAGFALGLGRPVIWTCQKSDFDDAHFDTRPYNHILWQTVDELREKLTARIRATISNAKRI